MKNFNVSMVGDGEIETKKIQSLLIILSDPREEDGHGNKHSAVFVRTKWGIPPKCHFSGKGSLSQAGRLPAKAAFPATRWPPEPSTSEQTNLLLHTHFQQSHPDVTI